MPHFSQFAISGPTLRRVIFSLSLLAMCGILTAGEDSARAEEFKNMAREDVGRLQEQGEARKLEDSLHLKANIEGFNQPQSIGGGPSLSARLKEKKEKEEEEKEEERNWLLDSVRKLSGKQELTDEEKEKLKDLSGDLNLVDRYVAERLRERMENEEAEEKMRMAERESFEEDEASTEYRQKIPGLADSAPANPLKALEEKFMADALRKAPSAQYTKEAEPDSGKIAENPYLEPIGLFDFQFKKFNFFETSPAQNGISTAKINAPANPGPGLGSVLTEDISLPLMQTGNNPYFVSVLLQNPAAGLPMLPNLTNSQESLLPTLNPVPAVPGSATRESTQPDPQKPYRPLDADEKKYFPRLNRF